MKQSVLLFAAARQFAGVDRVDLEVPTGITIAELRNALGAAYPALKPLLAHVRFAVKNEYVADSTVVDSTSDVACIPPVSGG